MGIEEKIESILTRVTRIELLLDKIHSEQPQKKEDGYIYCTVKQIADDKSFCFTVAMLRYYIQYAHRNGLAKALRRTGKKVLIRKDLFIKWIEEKSQKYS